MDDDEIIRVVVTTAIANKIYFYSICLSHTHTRTLSFPFHMYVSIELTVGRISLLLICLIYFTGTLLFAEIWEAMEWLVYQSIRFRQWTVC